MRKMARRGLSASLVAAICFGATVPGTAGGLNLECWDGSLACVVLNGATVNCLTRLECLGGTSLTYNSLNLEDAASLDTDFILHLPQVVDHAVLNEVILTEPDGAPDALDNSCSPIPGATSEGLRWFDRWEPFGPHGWTDETNGHFNVFLRYDACETTAKNGPYRYVYFFVSDTLNARNGWDLRSDGPVQELSAAGVDDASIEHFRTWDHLQEGCVNSNIEAELGISHGPVTARLKWTPGISCSLEQKRIDWSGSRVYWHADVDGRHSSKTFHYVVVVKVLAGAPAHIELEHTWRIRQEPSFGAKYTLVGHNVFGTWNTSG